MGGNVGAFLAVDQAVFRGDDGGAAELADELVAIEDPTGDPEFVVDGIDPESLIFDGPAKRALGRDVAIEQGYFSDDFLARLPDFAPWLPVKISVEIEQGVMYHLSAKQRLGPRNVGDRAGIDRLIDESQPLVIPIEVFETDRFRGAPELGTNMKTGAEGIKIVGMGLTDVGPFEAIGAIKNQPIDNGADIPTFTSDSGIKQ